MSSNEPDWIARAIALLSLVVAGAGLAWQWYSWRRSGPYLQVKSTQYLRGPLVIFVANSGRADVSIELIWAFWVGRVQPFGPFVYRTRVAEALPLDELPQTVKSGHSLLFEVDFADVPNAFIRVLVAVADRCFVSQN
ncbi:hypothetical protein ACPSM1_19260 [Micromonospora chersina]|uniref:hypothetical protein n=1 Tax=Micromonospora chersina TaxID=47854 RepID=UPI003CA0EB56